MRFFFMKYFEYSKFVKQVYSSKVLQQICAYSLSKLPRKNWFGCLLSWEKNCLFGEYNCANIIRRLTTGITSAEGLQNIFFSVMWSTKLINIIDHFWIKLKYDVMPSHPHLPKYVLILWEFLVSYFAKHVSYRRYRGGEI